MDSGRVFEHGQSKAAQQLEVEIGYGTTAQEEQEERRAASSLAAEEPGGEEPVENGSGCWLSKWVSARLLEQAALRPLARPGCSGPIVSERPGHAPQPRHTHFSAALKGS